MTTQIARFTTRDLQQAQKLVQLSNQIDAMADPAELSDAREQLEAVKAYAKASGLADDIARKASLLSVQCALRIGVCGDEYIDNIRPKTHVTFVRYLLSHRTYDELMDMLSSDDGPASLNALRKAVAAEETEKRNAATAHDIMHGRPSPHEDYDWMPAPGRLLPETIDRDTAEVFVNARKDAIQVLLSGQEGAFRVSDVAEEYMRALTTLAAEGASEELLHSLGDPSLTEGIAEMVRYELRFANCSSHRHADGDYMPEVITYFDDSAREWIRVPWQHATLGQLRSMAAFRKKQADELAAAAAELNSLVETLNSRALGKVYRAEDEAEIPLTRFKLQASV